MTFDTEKVKFYRKQIERLEIDFKSCGNIYGIAPCTASAGVGNECYNTFPTCQDKPNFTATTRTVSLCHRGGIINPGENLRPYMTRIDTASTEIVREKGLAIRGRATIGATDEECTDLLDPYRTTRAAQAGGTFWRRLLARNPNYFGVTARLKRGFATEPFSLDAIRTEEYIVQKIAGPDTSGNVTITLADRIKLLDNTKAPTPSRGKLSQRAITEVGPFPSGTNFLPGLQAHTLLVYCRSGSSTTVQFGEDAEPIDDYYVGLEVYLIDGTGAGQKRVITDYVGASRLATVSVAWDVNPNATSVADLSALSITVDDATDYASSGYVALGEEVIRYTSKVGNTLYWPDSDYRAQFGTERIDHDAGAKVQQCLVYEDVEPYTVLEDLLDRAGFTVGQISLNILSELESWAHLGNITACVMAPELISKLVEELCADWNLDLWWDAKIGAVNGKCNTPEQVWNLTTITDDELMLEKTSVERMDDMRITQAATDYAIRSASAARDSAESYLAGELFVDTDAESANGFGDIRQSVRRSRWMGVDNALLVRANTNRKLLRLRNVPIKFSFSLDYRNEVELGELVIIQTRYLLDMAGNPRAIKAKITKIDDTGKNQQVEAISAFFSAEEDARRFGFVAPDGLNDYTTATAEQQAKYCFVANSSDLMSNGDEGYYIS